MSTVLGVIPARYHSTRFPGKVLAPILGKPLIQWVYENVSRSALLGQVLIATEDERVKNAVETFGGTAVMTSDKHVSGTDRIWEAVCHRDVDIVVNIQGDEPLIPPGAIDDLVRPLIEDEDVSLSTLAYRSNDQEQFLDPNIVKVVFDKDNNALFFSRTPIPYDRDSGVVDSWYKHIGVYAYRKSLLQWFSETPPGKLEQREKLEQLRVLENGATIKVVLSEYDTMGVDVPEDIGRVEKLLMN